jgi:hypothetical protein
MRGLMLAVGLLGCGSTNRGVTALSPSAQASAERATASTESMTASSEVTCADFAVRFEAGGERGRVCPADAKAHGLTVIDLGDNWTPALFAPGPNGEVPTLRASYIATANEKDAKGGKLTGEDALQELYGVVPSLSVVRGRLADDARHACHAKIDPAQVALLDRPLAQDDSAGVRWINDQHALLTKQLEVEAKKRNLADVPSLLAVADDKPTVDKLTQWKKLDDILAGLTAAQAHYRCEGLLDDKEPDGQVGWRTGNATELFQRRNFLMPDERINNETREALALDSRELDYRLALRVLRERVIDATGLIEDGTAGAGPLPVLGRALDPAAMRAARGSSPLPNAAPDLVDPATELAAKHLGWTGPAEVRAFLDRHPEGIRVAVALPPPPAYHATHMDLAAEIDRGDVYYDDEPPLYRRIAVHRPSLVLYADAHATRRPLVRWPTTIGGWADQRLPGGDLVQRWKESDVGPRVWRDLYAGPTWLPPPTTPDRDLVKNLWNGKWGLKTEVMGPGPHAAYGMMLLVHHEVIKLKDGTERFDDNGIGTHGSASVTSIVNGTSHGCHRLYNQLAVRLGDFLLKHRDHVVKGEQKDWYRRVVEYHGTFQAKIDTRGFLYELTPPVQVNVLKGKIVSPRKIPPRLSAPAKP